MSERLVFELQAIDRATAPLKAVQTQLDNTTAATRRFASQTSSATTDMRKFALGGLQQAGYQIGDFAVQVANGTNKIQAFGQQAPQILQIFGPLGAVAGAAVAIFAAVAVTAEKAAGGVTGLAKAMGDLTGASAGLSSQMEMLRFGVDTAEEATVLRSIIGLRDQIAKKTEEYRATDSLSAKQNLAEQITALKVQLSGQKSIIDEINKKRDAIAQIDVINRGMMAVELGHAKAVGQAERERIAKGEAIYGQMIAIQSAQAEYIKSQESFNNRLQLGYALYGNLRRQAQGLAADAAAAAQAAVDPQMFKTIGAYQVYAKTRLAAPTEPTKPKEEKSSGGGATDPMKTLKEQLALESELLGKTEAQQRVIQALGLDYKKYGDAALQGLVGQITKMDELNRLAEQQKAIASTIRDSFSSAFMSMVDGTKSVKDAFRDMARNIIMKLYEVLVVQRLVNGIMGVVGKAFPALAPAIAGFKAMGGSVTGGQAYMVGERGPELVVPSRNAQVIPNNQLGGGGVTVVQNINVSTGVQQTVRAEIKSLMPQIADSAKAAVLDAKRRGGAYGGAFA
jgi:hypothetical protein